MRQLSEKERIQITDALTFLGLGAIAVDVIAIVNERRKSARRKKQ